MYRENLSLRGCLFLKNEKTNLATQWSCRGDNLYATVRIRNERNIYFVCLALLSTPRQTVRDRHNYATEGRNWMKRTASCSWMSPSIIDLRITCCYLF